MNTKKIDTAYALQLRQQGLTYQQIAQHFGVSKQRIAQVLSRSAGRLPKSLRPEECIYPGLRIWMNHNAVSRSELARRMGYAPDPGNYVHVSDMLRGKIHLRKTDIDKLILTTALPYEILFGKPTATQEE